MDNEWIQVIQDENNLNFFSKSNDEDIDDSKLTRDVEGDDDDSLVEEERQCESKQNAETINRVLSSVFKGIVYNDKRTSERILQLLSSDALNSYDDPHQEETEDENDEFDSSHILKKDELVRSSGALPSFESGSDMNSNCNNTAAEEGTLKETSVALQTNEQIGGLTVESSRPQSSKSNVWRPSLRLRGISPADFFKKTSSTNLADNAVADELQSSAGDDKSSVDCFDSHSEISAVDERYNLETFEYYDDFQGENVALKHSTML